MSAREITVCELQESRRETRAGQWIDVRSPSEFATGHLPGAVNIPLAQIEGRQLDLRPDLPIVLVCQAGTRARIAAGLLESRRSDVSVLSGGTNGWVKAGLPLVASSKSRWSLERQVRLAAGLLVVAGSLLAIVANVRWAYVSAFIGLGLIFAGVTNLCGMAALLAWMPWNRPRASGGARARLEGPKDATADRENGGILASWTLNRWPTSTKTRSTAK
ncbi:MAG: rhodanese-like domain-containing protein [Candidatus Acidiferrales bacterium]